VYERGFLLQSVVGALVRVKGVDALCKRYGYSLEMRATSRDYSSSDLEAVATHTCKMALHELLALFVRDVRIIVEEAVIADAFCLWTCATAIMEVDVSSILATEPLYVRLETLRVERIDLGVCRVKWLFYRHRSGRRARRPRPRDLESNTRRNTGMFRIE
jgi:hypothetical protein